MAKGSAFERKVCKDLSRWVTKGERSDVFWRSALSGGRATVALRTRGEKLAAAAGDICAIDTPGIPFAQAFVVQCKHYKSLDLEGLLFCNNTGMTHRTWNETLNEGAAFDKKPFMILRQNNRPILVGTDVYTLNKLFPATLPARTVIFRNDNPALCLYKFDDFLELADPTPWIPESD